MGICPRCRHNAQEECEVGTLCVGCGLVLDALDNVAGDTQGVLVRHGETGFSSGGCFARGVGSPLVNSELAIKELLGKLNLQQKYLISRALDIHETAKARQEPPHVVKEVLRAAAVCIACREQQKPVFLADMAALVQLSVSEFTPVLKRVERLVKADAPMVDSTSFMRHAVNKLIGADSSKRQSADIAEQILGWLKQLQDIQLSSNAFIQTACAVQLTAEVVQAQISTAEIAREFRLQPITLMRAMRPVRRYLLEVAKSVPWFSSLSEKTVGCKTLSLMRMDAVKRIAAAKPNAARKAIQDATESTASERMQEAGDERALVVQESDRADQPLESNDAEDAQAESIQCQSSTCPAESLTLPENTDLQAVDTRLEQPILASFEQTPSNKRLKDDEVPESVEHNYCKRVKLA